MVEVLQAQCGTVQEQPFWGIEALFATNYHRVGSSGNTDLVQSLQFALTRFIKLWFQWTHVLSFIDSSPVIKLEIWVNSLHKFLLYLPVVFHERFMIEDWTKKLMQNGKKSFQIISCRSSRVFLREVSCPCNPTVFVLGFLCCQPMQQSPSLSNLWFPLLACKKIYIYIYILAPKHK